MYEVESSISVHDYFDHTQVGGLLAGAGNNAEWVVELAGSSLNQMVSRSRTHLLKADCSSVVGLSHSLLSE